MLAHGARLTDHNKKGAQIVLRSRMRLCTPERGTGWCQSTDAYTSQKYNGWTDSENGKSSYHITHGYGTRTYCEQFPPRRATTIRVNLSPNDGTTGPPYVNAPWIEDMMENDAWLWHVRLEWNRNSWTRPCPVDNLDWATITRQDTWPHEPNCSGLWSPSGWNLELCVCKWYDGSVNQSDIRSKHLIQSRTQFD